MAEKSGEKTVLQKTVSGTKNCITKNCVNNYTKKVSHKFVPQNIFQSHKKLSQQFPKINMYQKNMFQKDVSQKNVSNDFFYSKLRIKAFSNIQT